MCSIADPEAPPAGDAARLDRVRRLVAARNRISAELAAAVREAEVHQSAEHDGLKSMRSWLRGHARLAGRAIAQLAGNGRALPLLPAVAAAFTAGAVTADQVDVIAVNVRPEHLDRAAGQDIDLAVVEQALLLIATTQPHAKLQTAVGTYLARLDPDGREPDPTEALTLAQHPDGGYT